MELGLLLNTKNELPTPIIDLIGKLAQEMAIKFYNVTNLFGSGYSFKENILFESLAQIEATLSQSKIDTNSFHAELAKDRTINDMDFILCWRTDPNIFLRDSTKVIYLYLNDERLDRTSSGLIETLNEQSFEVSIRCNSENHSLKLASMRCKTYRSFAKTKANALNNICILLKKVIKGEVSNPEMVQKISNFKVHKECSLLVLIMYKAIKSRISSKKTSIICWNLYVGDSNDIVELGKVNRVAKMVKHDGDRFWADPFVHNHGGINYIFVEEYLYSHAKGNIAVLKQEPNGTFAYMGVVLDLEYHLSYPFIFEVDGAIYMIPETGSKKRIDLYRCREYPLGWEFCRTLLSGFKYVDTTVFFHGGKYWVFTSALREGINPDSQLLIYYTDNIVTGDLTEHPFNPVAYGVDHSRMAGAVFTWQDKVIRPAQDCSKIYGGAIRFMVIEEMSESSYLESQYDQLAPFNGHEGTHTFNCNNSIFVVDTYN